MTSGIWKSAVVVVLTGVLIASFGRGAAANSADWETSARKLEGTWSVQVTLHNCQTGVQIGAPFQSLLTFARGGTVTETTSNPMFFPAQRGPGHGVWSYTGQQNYSAASMAFITVNGALVKTQKISQTIQIGDNPDAFATTESSVQFFDPAGNLLATGCATAAGQRFE
jgi:hypothetical protein